MKNTQLWKQMKKYQFIYFMLLPIAVYFLVFSYYPLALGIVYSFQKSKLLGEAEFAGLANYRDIFSNPLYYEAFINTVVVGLFSFMAEFILGLAVALSLNEIKHKFVKSTVQSVTYLPNILSWAIVGGMWMTILSPSGLINGILKLICGSGFHQIVFMSEPRFARTIMVLTGAWKHAGYYTVLFLAAMTGIDPMLYEAASIDGTSRFQQIFYITLPNLVSTMKVLVVLGSMGVLRNFDQIYIMGNSSIYGEVRNLLFLIYTDGILNFKVGTAMAAATMLLVATYILATIIRKLVKYDQTYD
jgi:putative aldouronate transport system permease protein